MAKYIEVPSLGMFTYALDECEDYLTLDAYLRIKDSGKFERSKHLRTFEWYHLQEGGTLNDNILLQLNASLRLLGRPSLVFVNGHTTNYAYLRGQEKVTRRHAILHHLAALDTAERLQLIEQRRAEAARLPARKDELPNRPPASDGSLNRQEIERRRQALARAQQEDAARPPPAVIGHAPPAPPDADRAEREFVPESTVQDNVVELITEMQDLKAEVAALKGILQTIFRNV